MPGIIVAFPNLEDAKKIKGLLIRKEYQVVATCTSGSHVIGVANDMDEAILICGYRLSDMHYSELFNYLPRECSMLLVASPVHLAEGSPSDIVKVAMPIKVRDLLDTLEMMTYQFYRRNKKTRQQRVRSEQDIATIHKAKELLMDRNGMTEEEAHRYIQKISMDSGNQLVETAGMILALQEGR